MAIVIFFVIAFAVCKTNAAALQINGSTDLEEASNKNETASSYQPSEKDPTDNEKVIIDLYKPSQPHETKYSKLTDDDSIVKNATPFVQVVVDQSNASELTSTEMYVPNDSIVEQPQTTASPLQLIPPASVPPSIDKLDRDSSQKQGQIIIRYANFSNKFRL